MFRTACELIWSLRPAVVSCWMQEMVRWGQEQRSGRLWGLTMLRWCWGEETPPQQPEQPDGSMRSCCLHHSPSRASAELLRPSGVQLCWGAGLLQPVCFGFDVWGFADALLHTSAAVRAYFEADCPFTSDLWHGGLFSQRAAAHWIFPLFLCKLRRVFWGKISSLWNVQGLLRSPFLHSLNFSSSSWLHKCTEMLPCDWLIRYLC